MLFELIFLVTGVWLIISGKVPAGLFKFLFGKGEYTLTSRQVRLFGLFLSSPLPASFIVSMILSALLGKKGSGYAIIFEQVYIFVVIIAAIIIARKAKHPEIKPIENPPAAMAPVEQKTNGYGSRLLIMFGLVFLGFITTVSLFALVMVIINSIRFGARLTGNFWSDFFPFILMITIIGIGSFGIFKLVQVLRKPSGKNTSILASGQELPRD